MPPIIKGIVIHRVAEALQRHGGPSPKSLDPTKILSPNMRCFVAILRFVAIYAVFLKSLGKKCLFGSKIVFLGQEVHYYIVYTGCFRKTVKSKTRRIRPLELREGGGPALPHLLHYHHPEPEVEVAHVRRLGWPGNGGEEHLQECQGLQGSSRRKL